MLLLTSREHTSAAHAHTGRGGVPRFPITSSRLACCRVSPLSPPTSGCIYLDGKGLAPGSNTLPARVSRLAFQQNKHDFFWGGLVRGHFAARRCLHGCGVRGFPDFGSGLALTAGVCEGAGRSVRGLAAGAWCAGVGAAGGRRVLRGGIRTLIPALLHTLPIVAGCFLLHYRKRGWVRGRGLVLRGRGRGRSGGSGRGSRAGVWLAAWR